MLLNNILRNGSILLLSSSLLGLGGCVLKKKGNEKSTQVEGGNEVVIRESGAIDHKQVEVGVEKPEINENLEPFDFDLPNMPIVKAAFLNHSTMVILGEELLIHERDGQLGYVHDHRRRLLIKRRNEADHRVIDFRPGPGFSEVFITDIATLPSQQTVVAAYVGWDADLKKVRHGLALVEDSSGSEQVTYHELTEIEFPEFDKLTDNVKQSQAYRPITLDISHLAVDGHRVALVARNTAYTLFTGIYTIGKSGLELQHKQVLLPPRVIEYLGMSGGTYDVMGQLVDRYKVHAAFLADGTLIAGSSEYGYPDVIKYRFPMGEAAAHNNEEDYPQTYAMLIKLSSDYRTSSLRWYSIGFGDDAHFHSLGVAGQDFLISGLSRDYEKLNGESHLRFINDKIDVTIDLPGASASASTLLFADGHGWLVGGSKNWTQNPAGISIYGGNAYLGRLNPLDLTLTTHETGFEGLQHGQRSEVRGLTVFSPGIFCASGMNKGPDTHYADHDKNLLTAQGFVRCFRLSEL